ncbi:M48 family metalloprotease [Candidatus Ruthia endofausta]|uniref:M48 family metalloprotease n=1 Tax=Candidatus Ruthia endofausta TaxID=2738852 RepID=A0A6N0HMZ2_9GAMM|nr:M48 family metallopeptidase [Candidatus Ruthia endofausta]QKQ23709.1 M48 family metalloprotease [Candidatus Ruthia endofausta]
MADIETQVYLKKLGYELSAHSENPSEYLDFFMLNDDDINAFAGPYGYIGMLLSSDSGSELVGVLSHEISHVTQNHLTRFSEKTGKFWLYYAANNKITKGISILKRYLKLTI